MKEFAIIYDLDQTILPAEAVPEETFLPIYEAIRSANKGHLPESELESALKKIRTTAMDVIAEEYHFSEEMAEAAKQAFINSSYDFTLSPFDDFSVLQHIPGKRFLVTSGITKMQQAKIDALFEEGYFDAIVIDDIYSEERRGKKQIFAELAEAEGLIPDLVWIVGDNPTSEIASGNELGMKTIQIVRPGVEQSGEASFVVSSFYELNDLISKWETSLTFKA
jgi:FMN phosphatase YigB (HAD superfamily)